jgi:hypothetical protein
MGEGVADVVPLLALLDIAKEPITKRGQIHFPPVS